MTQDEIQTKSNLSPIKTTKFADDKKQSSIMTTPLQDRLSAKYNLSKPKDTRVYQEVQAV